MKSTFEKLQRLFDRAQGSCAYCQRQTVMPAPAAKAVQPTMSDGLRATIDHKTPLSRGGTWRWGNIVLACSDCNHRKGNMRLPDWERFMAKNPNWWVAGYPCDHHRAP